MPKSKEREVMLQDRYYLLETNPMFDFLNCDTEKCVFELQYSVSQ